MGQGEGDKSHQYQAKIAFEQMKADRERARQEGVR